MVMNDETKFSREEDLLSFVEGRVKQLNMELDDFARVAGSQAEENKEKAIKHLYREIEQLQGIIQRNYVRLSGGKGRISNWEEIEMYSWTITLLERLTEIKDTG